MNRPGILESSRKFGPAGGLCSFAGLALLLALLGPGCASGPQVVPVTPVTNLTVNVYAYDGGAIRFGELWIDGTSADGQAQAQGVDVDADVDTSIETSVSAVP